MYDAIIIGGGIAGLQAAIQLGRYQHRVLVLDANRGRSTLCRSYHNLLGWPDGVSGVHLRSLGREQAQKLGVEFLTQIVTRVARGESGFEVSTEEARSFHGCTLLLATGVVDNIPPIPGILPALGVSIYVCPDCDGYECRDQRTVVLGTGETGAGMALELRYWTAQLTYVHHPGQPIGDDTRQRLRSADIDYIDGEIALVETDANSMIESVMLADGRRVPANRGFVAFGGNKVESDLATQIGAARTKNHIAVNPRTKMTSVTGVWAAGDVAVHSEQVSIAMGDGSQAAIFMHKALLGQTVEGYSGAGVE